MSWETCWCRWLFTHKSPARPGNLNLTDIMSHINRKLVRRHPHVFGDVTVTDAKEVERNWERLKKEENRDNQSRKSAG